MTTTVRYFAPLVWQGAGTTVTLRQAAPVVWSTQNVSAYIRNLSAIQWFKTPTPVTVRKVTALQWAQDYPAMTIRKVTALQWTQDGTKTLVRGLNAITWAQQPTNGYLRQVAVKTLQQSSTSGSLRLVSGATLQLTRKVQKTGGLAGLWALIVADAKIALNQAQVSVSAPVADSSQPYTNTYVTVAPLGALLQQYSGSTKLYYNRVNIDRAFLTSGTQWLLGTIASATTIRALIPQINTAYSIALDPTDVVDGPVAAGATKLLLVADPGSYVFTPGTQLYLQNTVALGVAIANPNLPGFAGAGGVGGPTSYTVSLLHFDGANGSTAFTDQKGRVWTPAGGAAISTALFKFGTASFNNAGTAGKYISTPDSTDLHLTGDFTIEFFVYGTNPTTSSVLVAKGSGGRINMSGGSIFAYDDTVGNQLNGGSISANTWYHIALVKKNGTTTLYVNGATVATSTAFGSFGNNTGVLAIGSFYDGSYPMLGNVDEFRISNIARYTAPFTPPAAAFGLD